MSKLFTNFLASCLVLIAVSLAAHPQTGTATLTGTVKDQQDASVPNAAITVENLGTRQRRTMVTNESGYFIVPLLPPGSYSVTVERDGFATVLVNDLILNVADNRSIAVQLEIKTKEEVVTVEANAVTVRTDGGGLGTIIDRNFVGNLPLNGRSFQSLVLLTPGVTITQTTLGQPLNGQFSVNGQRASANSYTIDGVSANIGITETASGSPLGGAYAGQSAFGGTNNLVSVDALEEFKVQTSTYTADAGRQPGGQIQVMTRSGTNDFHGTAFDYLRNEAFEARNYFNKKPAPQTRLRQNHFGATFGGPVFLPNIGDGGNALYSGKDKTFFFFSYEGQRLLLPTNGAASVPSIRLRQNAASSIQPILNAYPIPTQPETTVSCNPTAAGCSPQGTRPSGTALFDYSVTNPSNLDATSVRLDHHLRNGISIFGRFNESPSYSGSGSSIRRLTISSTRTLTVGADVVLGRRWTAEFRANFSRQRAANDNRLTDLGGAVPIDESLLTSGFAGSGSITILSTNMTVGSFADSFQRQMNLVGNISVIRGNHRMKLGLDFRRLTPIYGIQNQQTTSFTTEAQLVAGRAISVSLLSRETARPQYNSYSAFAQDSWKVNSRLNLDLGVRWEYNPPPTEAAGRPAQTLTGVDRYDVRNAALAPPGTLGYKPFYTAFAPRFGAAYAINRRGGLETVLRGGFGVYYDLGNANAARGWPLSSQTNLLDVSFPLSPSVAIWPQSSYVTTLPTTTIMNVVDPDIKLPFTLQWNVDVQQALGKNQTLSVAYVASAARRLLTNQLLNRDRVNPETGAVILRQNLNFRDINFSYNGPTSDYHSMQAQYRIRLKDKVQGIVNYTWSHAIDEVSNDITGGVLERGNADFDVRHNLSAAATWLVPTLVGGKVGNAIFKNWTFDAIAHVQSGLAVNLTGSSQLFDEYGTVFNIRPDLVPGVPLYIYAEGIPGGRRFNPAAFRQPPTVPGSPLVAARQGTLGRNVLRTLPIHQFDISLGRIFPLTEHVNLQLKAEAFNVFNHPMFNPGGLNPSQSSFGIPSQTLGESLRGLGSLYQIGGPRSLQFSARVSF